MCEHRLLTEELVQESNFANHEADEWCGHVSVPVITSVSETETTVVFRPSGNLTQVLEDQKTHAKTDVPSTSNAKEAPLMELEKSALKSVETMSSCLKTSSDYPLTKVKKEVKIAAEPMVQSIPAVPEVPRSTDVSKASSDLKFEA